jgi:hypothetical protein
MAKRTGRAAPWEGIEHLAAVFSRAAQKLDGMAEALEPDGGGLEALNTGKTASPGRPMVEIEREDEWAAKTAAPLVKVLDSMSRIINNAALEVKALAAERFEGRDEAEAAYHETAYQDTAYQDTAHHETERGGAAPLTGDTGEKDDT